MNIQKNRLTARNYSRLYEGVKSQNLLHPFTCLLGLLIIASGSSAQAQTWTGNTSSSWGTGSNWSGNAAPTSSGAVIFNTTSPNQSVDLGGNQSAGNLTYSTTSANYTLSNGTLTLSGAAAFSGNGTGLFTIASNLTLSNSTATIAPGTGGLVISGNLTSTATTITGLVNNAGPLTLSGSNSFGSGGIQLQNNTLRLGSNTALGSGPLVLGPGGSRSPTVSSDSTTARTFSNAVSLNVAGNTITFGNSTNSGQLTFGNATDIITGNKTLSIASAVVFTGGLNGSVTGNLTVLGGSTTFDSSKANTLTIGGTSNLTETLVLGGSGKWSYLRFNAATFNGSGGIQLTGASNTLTGLLELTGNSTVNATVTVPTGVAAGGNNNNGYAPITSTSGSNEIKGLYTMDGVAETKGPVVNVVADQLTLSGGVDGALGSNFQKDGAGLLALTGNTTTNVYTIQINQGTLRAAQGTGLSTSTGVQFGGQTGTLSASDSPVLETSGTFSRNLGTVTGASNQNVAWLAGASGGFAAKGGNLTVQLNNGTGNLTWSTVSGTTNFLTSGALVLSSTTADGVVDFQNGLVFNGNGGAREVRVLDNPNTTADYARISGSITGANGLTKTGAGLLELTGNNSYGSASYTTSINAGTLRVGSANALGNTSGNITFGGGTLQYSSNNTADYSARITSSTAGAIAIDTNNQNVTYASALGSSNTAGLTKSGSGSLVLSGNNTFTGNVSVNAGTLTANATSGKALGGITGITVNSGGTLLLGAANQIKSTAAVTLAGGTFQLGGAFNETAGSLTLSSNSTIDFGAGFGASTLDFGTTYNGGGFKLTVSNFGVGDTLILGGDQTTNLSNTNLFGFSSGFSAVYNGSSFTTITAVPEPGTIAAGLALVGFIAWRERRRLRALFV